MSDDLKNELLEEPQQPSEILEEAPIPGPLEPPMEELEKLRAELEEQKDKYIRLFAEFDNYKKRTAKERIELIRSASKDIVVNMLPVLDDFERAMKLAEEQKNDAIFPEGMRLVYHKMLGILQSQGLQAMESTGQDFNPEVHEAVSEIAAPNEELKGKVIETIEKGYFLNEKIIRYAKVVVAR